MLLSFAATLQLRSSRFDAAVLAFGHNFRFVAYVFAGDGSLACLGAQLLIYFRLRLLLVPLPASIHLALPSSASDPAVGGASTSAIAALSFINFACMFLRLFLP